MYQRIILFLSILFISQTSATQLADNQFSVLGLSIPYDIPENVDMIVNLNALINETNPDVICLSGGYEIGARLTDSLDAASHHCVSRSSVLLDKKPQDIRALIYKRGSDVKIGNSIGAAIMSFDPAPFQRLVHKTENGVITIGGNIVFQAASSTAPSSWAYYKDNGFNIHSMDLGAKSALANYAAQALSDNAQRIIKDEQELQKIYVGPYNGDVDAVKGLTCASKSLKLFGAPENTVRILDRTSVGRMLNTRCVDVFYSGTFQAVQSYLIPIYPTGQLHKDFELDLYEEGKTSFSLAEILPVLTVFEVEKIGE